MIGDTPGTHTVFVPDGLVVVQSWTDQKVHGILVG